MVGNAIGQQLNYGQYTAYDPPPSNPAGGTAQTGGSGPAGAGGLAGAGAPPPPPEAFGAALKAVLGDLTPKGDASAGADASEAQAEHLENLLSSSISGDTASYLARAMLKFYSEQRHEAVLDRQTLGLAAQSELMSSAAQLDKEADKMMTAAIVSLVTTCVASAITIAASATSAVMKAVSIGDEMKALKGEMGAMDKLGAAEGKVADIEDDTRLVGLSSNGELGPAKQDLIAAQKEIKSFQLQFKEAEKVANAGTAIGQIGHATGQLVSAAGEFNSKMTDAEVKHMEADAKRMDAMAENFRTQADTKKAIVEALDGMVHQILSFVKDMADAKADRMRSIVRG